MGQSGKTLDMGEERRTAWSRFRVWTVTRAQSRPYREQPWTQPCPSSRRRQGLGRVDVQDRAWRFHVEPHDNACRSEAAVRPLSPVNAWAAAKRLRASSTGCPGRPSTVGLDRLDARPKSLRQPMRQSVRNGRHVAEEDEDPGRNARHRRQPGAKRRRQARRPIRAVNKPQPGALAQPTGERHGPAPHRRIAAGHHDHLRCRSGEGRAERAIQQHPAPPGCAQLGSAEAAPAPGREHDRGQWSRIGGRCVWNRRNGHGAVHVSALLRPANTLESGGT